MDACKNQFILFAFFSLVAAILTFNFPRKCSKILIHFCGKFHKIFSGERIVKIG